jgi:hypothetical protein
MPVVHPARLLGRERASQVPEVPICVVPLALDPGGIRNALPNHAVSHVAFRCMGTRRLPQEFPFRGLPQRPNRSLCTLRIADHSETRNTRFRSAGLSLTGRDSHPLGTNSWFQGSIASPFLQDQAWPGAPHIKIFT